eukprot:124509-Alexandrium_andersonii.AAC.1
MVFPCTALGPKLPEHCDLSDPTHTRVVSTARMGQLRNWAHVQVLSTASSGLAQHLGNHSSRSTTPCTTPHHTAHPQRQTNHVHKPWTYFESQLKHL